MSKHQELILNSFKSRFLSILYWIESLAEATLFSQGGHSQICPLEQLRQSLAETEHVIKGIEADHLRDFFGNLNRQNEHDDGWLDGDFSNALQGLAISSIDALIELEALGSNEVPDSFKKRIQSKLAL